MTDLPVLLGTTVDGFESFVLGKASESSELNELLGELVPGAGVGSQACKVLEGSKDYQGCLCDILNQESDKGPADTNANHLGGETQLRNCLYYIGLGWAYPWATFMMSD